MNIKELLGDAYKDDMSIEEINTALEGKNLVDASELPPTISKSTYDKTASELAKAKSRISELENANLSDNEKLKKALEDAKKVKDEYNRKSIRLDVENVFVSGGLKEEDYKGVIDSIVTDNAETSVETAKNLISLITNQKKAAEQAVKKEFQDALKKPPAGGDGALIKEDFDKMNLTEKAKFKAENPEQYNLLFGGK